MLLGQRMLAAQQRNLARTGMRAGEIRIELEGARETAGGSFPVTVAKRERGQTERKVGVVRSQFERAREQPGTFGLVAALMPKHAEQMHGIDIVGMCGELRAIALFGLVEEALAVQIDGFFEHADSNSVRGR
ncbi:MAG: hypothetical protein ABIS07_04390 [Dokdonella sp.]